MRRIARVSYPLLASLLVIAGCAPPEAGMPGEGIVGDRPLAMVQCPMALEYDSAAAVLGPGRPVNLIVGRGHALHADPGDLPDGTVLSLVQRETAAGDTLIVDAYAVDQAGRPVKTPYAGDVDLRINFSGCSNGRPDSTIAMYRDEPSGYVPVGGRLETSKNGKVIWAQLKHLSGYLLASP